MLPKTNEIDETLHNFFEQFGLDIDFCLDCDFNYYIYEQKIGYAFVVSEKHDQWYREYVASLDSAVANSDIFLLSLFHEVGHHMTIDDFSDWELKRYFNRKKVSKDNKQAYFRYFNSKIEKVATLWAIDFMNDNSAEIAKMWEELQQKIFKFYSECGLQ